MPGTITRKHTSARMSKIVIHNDTVYLCGQVANDYDGDMTQQTQEVLANVDALLKEAGSSREHMLSASVYVADMALFGEMNAVWDSWVPTGHAPARATVEAKMADPKILVEVVVVAARA